MANEIIDTIKAAIKESNSDNKQLESDLQDALQNGLKSLLQTLVPISNESPNITLSFKDYILTRKITDIGRYEDNIPLENNILIIQLVKENDIFYEVLSTENESNFNEVKKSINIKNLYVSNRESTGLYSYGGVLPRYYLDFIVIGQHFNPSIPLQQMKEKLL